MSISKNVGALARSLTKMRNRPKYHSFKYAFSHFLSEIPFVGKRLHRYAFKIKESVKNALYKSDFFSVLGYNYLGPVEGHDIKGMESIFEVALSYNRPSLVHIVTTKGKGYKFAESSPKNYHGVSPFDIEAGANTTGKLNFSEVAGKTLCELAEKDTKICAITAAMTEGTGLSLFAENYKSRFFDVGIAEQHAVCFGAGLASKGLKPYFAVYSSFLQRGFDQVIHDMAIGNQPLRLLIDRAGVVGEDGESHQGLFDVSYLTSVPDMTVFSASSYKELEYRIKFTAETDGLFAVRYPRGCEKDCGDFDFTDDFTLVKGNSEKVIVTYGRLFSEALVCKAETDVNIIKLNKIYPLSEELIDTLKKFKSIAVFEETVKSGGIGEHLSAMLLETGFNGEFKINAVDNRFVPQGETSSILNKLGLDSEAMINYGKNQT